MNNEPNMQLSKLICKKHLDDIIKWAEETFETKQQKVLACQLYTAEYISLFNKGLKIPGYVHPAQVLGYMELELMKMLEEYKKSLCEVFAGLEEPVKELVKNWIADQTKCPHNIQLTYTNRGFFQYTITINETQNVIQSVVHGPPSSTDPGLTPPIKPDLKLVH